MASSKISLLFIVLCGLACRNIDACAILGQLFCDKCWDGKYTSGLDSNLGGVKVSVNCTVLKGSQTLYYWGSATTASDGSFKATISGTSDLLGLLGPEKSFLSSLFTLGNVGLGLLAQSKVVGCRISANAPTCPILTLDDGNFRSDGALGNGWTSSNFKLATALSNADIHLGINGDSKNSIALCPTTKDPSCSPSSPPPPGIKGDPHFIGADGSHYDFTGEPGNNYCLLSDKHIHLNAYFGGRFDKWGDNPTKPLTWIRKLGILWGEHTITLSAREGASWQYDSGYMSKMEVDGVEVVLRKEGESVSLVNGEIEISWLAAKMNSGDDLVDVYLVKVGKALLMRLTLRPEIEMLRTPEDGIVHFNVEIPKSDFSDSVHGVMGQTFRSDHRFRLRKQQLVHDSLLNTDVIPGSNAEGFLDGNLQTYLTSGLLQPDCKVAKFTGAISRDENVISAVQLASETATSSSISLGRKMLKLA